MTSKDRQIIIRLHFFCRYTNSTLGRLFGVSRQRIGTITEPHKIQSEIWPDDKCMICGRDDEVPQRFFIDGDENNTDPQNIIMVCEYDKRRFEHLRRKNMLVTENSPILNPDQYLSSHL
jgi:hypothetical protein